MNIVGEGGFRTIFREAVMGQKGSLLTHDPVASPARARNCREAKHGNSLKIILVCCWCGSFLKCPLNRGCLTHHFPHHFHSVGVFAFFIKSFHALFFWFGIQRAYNSIAGLNSDQTCEMPVAKTKSIIKCKIGLLCLSNGIEPTDPKGFIIDRHNEMFFWLGWKGFLKGFRCSICWTNF